MTYQPRKLRTCGCCGEAKPSTEFSWNAPRHAYCPNCRDCGVWLRLFAEVFGKSRDWEKNRGDTRKRQYDARITGRPINIAGVNLWNAWHQPLKDSHA